MKSAGIVRKMDGLGRVVIPKETRKLLSIKEGDSLEIFQDEKDIILKRYSPGCIFCGNMDLLREFKEIDICEECREELRALNL